MKLKHSDYEVLQEQIEVLTYDEAAAFLKVQPGTLRTWVCKNKIPFHKVGSRSVRFIKHELEKFITGDSK